MTGLLRRTVPQVFAGVLLLQVVWALAVPPYRGMDEFDHVYRAESVAAGHVLPRHQPPGYAGRGDLVRARIGTIKAAYPICHSYHRYIADSDCRPVRTFADGTAEVASGAARYNPIFYAVVGLPSRWLGPAASLYAMRLMTAAICAALVAFAAWICSVWARTAWPLLAILLTCTPMAMFSGATPAPNGPEMFAGLALWTALVGLASMDPADPRTRTLLLAALPPAVLLCFLRTLGPLWLVMICLSVVALLGRRRVLQIARVRAVLVTVELTLVTCALVGSVAWSLAMGTNSLSGVADAHNPRALWVSVELVPAWVLQSIGAFPDKGDAAPALVYVAALLLMGTLAVRAIRRAEPRTRLVLAGVMFASVLVPFVVSVRTYSQLGAAWQGRYTWPFACGALVLVGLVLDRTRTPSSKAVLASVTLVVMAVIQAPGPVSVLRQEIRTSPLAGTAQWRLPPVWLLVAITVAALLMFADALLRAHARHSRGLGSDFGRADALLSRISTGAASS